MQKNWSGCRTNSLSNWISICGFCTFHAVFHLLLIERERMSEIGIDILYEKWKWNELNAVLERFFPLFMSFFSSWVFVSLSDDLKAQFRVMKKNIDKFLSCERKTHWRIIQDIVHIWDILWGIQTAKKKTMQVSVVSFIQQMVCFWFFFRENCIDIHNESFSFLTLRFILTTCILLNV